MKLDRADGGVVNLRVSIVQTLAKISFSPESVAGPTVSRSRRL